MRGCIHGLGLALGLLGAGAAVAQDTLPRSVPNLALLDTGSVEQLVRQPDGGVLVAGDFTTLDGVARNGLARLRPDGTVDLSFDPQPSSGPTHVALGPQGEVLVGGRFSRIGSEPRINVARLLPNGRLDPAWDAGLSFGTDIQALAVGEDGAVYLGGKIVIGQATYRLMKLQPGTGAPDMAWIDALQAPDEMVFDLAVDGDALYIGGRFSRMGDTPRSRLARVSASTGALDPRWDPAANDTVLDLDVDPLGRIVFVGNFRKVSGVDRRAAARVDAQGNLDMGWNPSVEGLPAHVTVLRDGSVLVAGRFNRAGGVARHNVARLAGTTGEVLPDVDAQFTWSSGAYAAAELGEQGPLLVGGDFTEVNGHYRLGIAGFGAGGMLPVRFDAGNDAIVDAVAAGPDGALVVGGRFVMVNGEPQPHLARVRPDGSFDEDWRPQINFSVGAIAVDARGDVFIGGGFTEVDGHATARLAKLDGSTARRIAWSPNPNGRVWALRLDDAGNLYAAGDFDSIGGGGHFRAARFTPELALTPWTPSLLTRPRDIAVHGDFVYIGGDEELARFWVTTGVRDFGWRPEPDGGVNALEIDAEGRIYVGGDFSRIGGASRRGLARLDAVTGAADPGWTPAPAQYGYVYALAVDRQGALYVGGSFSQMGGQPRYNLAKLDMETGVAIADWRPRPDSSALTLTVMPNGDLAAGGFFTSVSGQVRTGLAVVPAVHRDRRANHVTFATPAPGPYVYGGVAGAVSAQASSGLPVRYGSLTPSLCSIHPSSGQITLLGAGTCIASADQDGDEEWLPAPQATQPVVIERAPQSALSLTVEPEPLDVGGLAALSTQGGSGIGEVGYVVTAGQGKCELVPPATLRALSVGTCTVTATRDGDHNHLPGEASALVRVRGALSGRVFGDGFE